MCAGLLESLARLEVSIPARAERVSVRLDLYMPPDGVLVGSTNQAIIGCVGCGLEPAAAAKHHFRPPSRCQYRFARRAGVRDVKETVWDHPGATPTVTTWVARRRMVGEFLEEILEPPPGATASQIQRIDYLSYHRIEGRWKYVSMDTRASVEMIPASSADRGDIANIQIVFEPFAIPMKDSIAGQLLSMKETIRQIDANHDEKDQYFNLADGTGNSWLKHKYVYVRRPIR